MPCSVSECSNLTTTLYWNPLKKAKLTDNIPMMYWR